LATNIKSDVKSFWNYARSKMRKDNVGPLEGEDGDAVSDDSMVAELLNDYFCSVFTEEDIANIPACPDVASQAITTSTVKPEQVAKVCSGLKVNKAAGVECIAPIILNKLSEEIKKPLSQIFQQSLDTRDNPSDWRSANVTPIYKKGPRNKTFNYRPVSLTSVPGKYWRQLYGVVLSTTLTEARTSDTLNMVLCLVDPVCQITWNFCRM
jgi:hypothetical protein